MELFPPQKANQGAELFRTALSGQRLRGLVIRLGSMAVRFSEDRPQESVQGRVGGSQQLFKQRGAPHWGNLRDRFEKGAAENGMLYGTEVAHLAADEFTHFLRRLELINDLARY